MKFELYERRVKNELIDGDGSDENACPCCDNGNNVNQSGPFESSTNGLTDASNNPMMERPVSCLACGEKWVDVFCIIYPVVNKSEDDHPKE